MKKIIALGNEFLKQDSLAKQLAQTFSQDFEIINIQDSFQLMTVLNETSNPIILDVVQNLPDVKTLKLEDLRNDSILTAHDFDASYVLKLIGKEVKIIGIPMKGDFEEIRKKVLEMLS